MHIFHVHFYGAALYARGLSYGKAVCLSVCLSVTRVHCDITNKSSADILTPYERKIRTLRTVGGGRPLLPEILDQTDPPSFKNGGFQSIFAPTVSGLTT